jgi:hypothetical protein
MTVEQTSYRKLRDIIQIIANYNTKIENGLLWMLWYEYKYFFCRYIFLLKHWLHIWYFPWNLGTYYCLNFIGYTELKM